MRALEQQAYSRSWYLKNRERVLQKAKERYRKNPEAHAARAAIWRAKNNEKIKEQQALYRKQNRKKIRESQRRWEHANKEQVRDIARAWRKKNPEKTRQARLKYRHGIDQVVYEKLFSEQKGLCGICGRPSKVAFAIDHDHKTGKIRGLLHRRCNSGLGFFEDNPTFLKAALCYLLRVQK